MSTAAPDVPEASAASPTELVPELFERFFAFFGPTHQGGVVPSRIKELARLKIAQLNDCNT